MLLSDHATQAIDAIQALLDHIDPHGLASLGKATPLVLAITNRSARLVSLLIPLEDTEHLIPPEPTTETPDKTL